METVPSRRRRLLGSISLLGLWLATAVSGAPPPAGAAADLAGTLDRATARVEEFFTRAQSLVCTETVHVQPLNAGLSADGFGRTVESELRLSWDPSLDGEGATEAQTHRRVVKINGRLKRDRDKSQCTSPERHDTEAQPLSMLLAGQREKFTFALAKPDRLEGRAALTVDFKERQKASGRVFEQEDDENCLTYQFEGGGYGRIWLDADSHDVLRLDTHSTYVELRLTPTLLKRPGVSQGAMVERADTTIRFKRVTFSDPEEHLILPASSTFLLVTRGAMPARQRVITNYSDYKRFLTGGRLVPSPPPQP